MDSQEIIILLHSMSILIYLQRQYIIMLYRTILIQSKNSLLKKLTCSIKIEYDLEYKNTEMLFYI